jgi:hypothetical protein
VLFIVVADRALDNGGNEPSATAPQRWKKFQAAGHKLKIKFMRFSHVVWALLALFVVVLLPLSLLLTFNGSRRISKANFECIRIGMTKEEVDALLGSKNLRTLGGGFLLGDTYSDDNYTQIIPGNVIIVEYAYPDRQTPVVRSKQYQPWTVKELSLRTKARLGL